MEGRTPPAVGDVEVVPLKGAPYFPHKGHQVMVVEVLDLEDGSLDVHYRCIDATCAAETIGWKAAWYQDEATERRLKGD